MQKSFMTELASKANMLKGQGLSFFEAYRNLKKEYKTFLSLREKFLEFLAFLMFALTLVLGIAVYYIFLQIDSHMGAYMDFDYGNIIFFFVLSVLVFLGILFLIREKIYDFFSFNQALLKAYDENSLKFYFKYIFLSLFVFLVISVVLIGFIAYHYALETNSSLGYSFSLILMEIFD